MATVSPKRPLTRSTRRGSRRSSTVARLHASAVAAKNRRASLAAAAALEEKAFLEESKSSSSLASSKSSMSVASKSSSMVGSKSSSGMCDKGFTSSPDSARKDVSNGSMKKNNFSLTVEKLPITRRSFDSASASTSSDLLMVRAPDAKLLAVSDTCIDSKSAFDSPPNRHMPLDQRLTINIPYQSTPRRSFDATPRRRASSSPRPSLATSTLLFNEPVSRRPSVEVPSVNETSIAVTSFVTTEHSITRNSSLRCPTFHREIPVHRKASLSNSTRRKSHLLPDDIPTALEPIILATRKSSIVIEPSSRKSSVAPDLASWKGTIGSSTLETFPRRDRMDSTSSNYSHLDIYRRHSSSASRISAPAETGVRGKEPKFILDLNLSEFCKLHGISCLNTD